VIGWLLFVVTGCGRCGFQPDPGIKIVVPAMPTTLDWSTSDPNSWANYPVMLATLRGLTSLGDDNAVQPGLAQRWERELRPDGREVYTFHLRTDVKWSDGVTPLTAGDFVFGWRRAVRGRERGEMLDVLGAEEVLRLLDSGAPSAQVHRAVESLGVEAIDPLTLRVTLGNPRNYFLSRLANVYLFFPAPSRDLAGRSEEEIRDYFDRPRGDRPLSLGPYRVQSWDRAGERVRLVQDPSSALAPAIGAGEAPAPVVTLMKSEVGPALYDRGRVDFVFIDSAVALKEERPADLRRRELLSTYFLAFNTLRAPLDRVEVRRAIGMALDRGVLLEGLLPQARLACGLLPPGLLGAHELAEHGCGAAGSDPKTKTLELLQFASELRRPLRLVYRAGESFIPEVAIAERIKSQLARVGVPVELEARYDFSAEIARIASDGFPAPDLYLRRIGADYAHPKTFSTFFERGGNHYTGWEKLAGGEIVRRFETILKQADAQPEPSAAAALYSQAERILLEEAAVIAPIYHPDRYYRVHPSLVGLQVDPFNFLSLRELRLRGALDRR